MNTGLCITVKTKLIKANVNIHIVTCVYAMLMYLMLYLNKPKHNAKVTRGKDISSTLYAIDNLFL